MTMNTIAIIQNIEKTILQSMKLLDFIRSERHLPLRTPVM